MEKFLEYLETEGDAPCAWAEYHKISRSVISRYLQGLNISVKNLLKIYNATEKRVSLEELTSHFN